MARTQAEIIEGLRQKVRELKEENNDLVNQNGSLSETISIIRDTASEVFEEETDEEETTDDGDYDPDLDD